MIKLKNTDQSENLEAQKIFTDREEPQEAFERKLDVLQDYWRETFLVLNYYGIGGIGKSSLLYRLCDVIALRRSCRYINPFKINCDKLVYDFENQPRDEKSILLRMRKLFKGINSQFQFPLFDAAITLYIQKSGEDIHQDEVAQTILESNSWLNSAVTAMGMLPGVGWLSNAISSLDMAFGAVLEMKKRKLYEKYLNEITTSEAPEIIKNLKNYFIIDMKRNMSETAERPIVIFLDTYEKFHDDMLNEGIKSFNDDWLWNGRNSVIRSVPGLMWVIMGRERLRWYDDDPTWAQDDPDCAAFVEISEGKLDEEDKRRLALTSFEQHRIGDLGEKDARDFLIHAGIQDEQLLASLYRLTNGTPVFLDLCVNQYYSIASIRQPGIADFGDNLDVLVTRYLNTFDSGMREMTYFLAALGTWNQNRAVIIAEAVGMGISFEKRHREYVNHSFINDLGDGNYSMHDTVRTAVLKYADARLVERIIEEKLKVLSLELDSPSNNRFGNTIDSLMAVFGDHLLCSDKIDDYIPILKKMYLALEQTGDYRDLVFKAKKLYDIFSEYYAGTQAELVVESIYLNSLLLRGMYPDAKIVAYRIEEEIRCNPAIDILEQCYIEESLLGYYRETFQFELYVQTGEKIHGQYAAHLGEEHLDTLRVYNECARGYTLLKQYPKALQIKEKVYEAQKRILGENHRDVIAVYSGIGNIYYRQGYYDKAIEIHREVYRRRKQLLGELYPDTVVTLDKIGLDLLALMEFQEAEKVFQKEYEQRLQVFGENHPNNLFPLSGLRRIYTVRGQYQEALKVSKHIYEKRRDLFGEDTPGVLTALGWIAMYQGYLGDFSEDLKTRKYIYEKRCELQGPNHIHTISALIDLGNCYHDVMGDYRKACEIYEEAYNLQRKIYGADHINTLGTQSLLGMVYKELGQYEKALHELRHVVEKYIEMYGEDNIRTACKVRNLGMIYLYMGRYEESLRALISCYERCEILTGDNMKGTLIDFCNCLGTVYEYMGEFEKSMSYYKKAYDKTIELFGEDNRVQMLLPFNNLGIAYRNLGQLEESLMFAQKAYNGRMEILGKKHPVTWKSELNLGLTYIEIGEFGKASELLHSIYENSREHYGASHPETLTSLFALGTLAERTGNMAEAKAAYESAYRERQKMLGSDHPETKRSLNALDQIRRREIDEMQQ